LRKELASAPLLSAGSFQFVPRPPRHLWPDQHYHVLNRANRGADVFHSAADYEAFVKLIARAQEHVTLQILAACLMPNHFHLVVRPSATADISRWIQWLCTTHARHYHEKYQSSGRVWQGRFKAFLVQDDHYLLTLLRYVERNALRKNLVDRAEDWRWGSLNWRLRAPAPLELTPPPMRLPSAWEEWVNQPQTAAELEAIRTSVNRQRPYGDPDWVLKSAADAGLGQSLVDVGRPRKARSDPFC
jgi:putative transposase